MADFVFDESLKALVKRPWGDQKLVHRRKTRHAGKAIEGLRQLTRELLAAGEQTQISVNFRRRGMVVPRAHMGIAPDPLALAADDQHGLCMGLESGHTINNIHSRFAHHAGPLDIRGLVETSLQFNHSRDLLPVPRRRDQCLHNRGIRAGAVERLLDRQHMRILRRLRQKIHDRLEAVIRMVQQDVALPNVEKQVRLGIQRNHRARREALVAKVWTVQLKRQWHETREVERTINAEYIFLLKVENLKQPAQHMLGTILFDLEPHGRTALDFAKLLFNRVQQIAGLFLIHIKVAITSHTEKVRPLHLHPTEERLHMSLDDVSQKNIVVAIHLRRKWHQPRKDARRLHDGDVRAQVIAFQLHNHIQALVQELRERMRGIHRQRSQNRINRLAEKLLEMLTLGLRNLGVVVKMDFLPLQRRGNVLAPAAVLIIHHLSRAHTDPGQRLGSGKPIRPGVGGASLLLLLETRDADLEKLIQIRADDTEKLQALQKRVRFVKSLIQHALVEFQPTQLAVDEIIFIREICGHREAAMNGAAPHPHLKMTLLLISEPDFRKNRVSM